MLHLLVRASTWKSLQLSGLAGYRTGGTIHVVINNQVGFTTSPHASRTARYSTDIAKMIEAPVFHVNGDDPEACVRVARLAFEYRQAFKKDVVIDMVCYRRRGHNEGDEPAFTQPLMYKLIGAKRTTRTLYTEALVGRGDITPEEAQQVQAEYQAELESVFASVANHEPDHDPNFKAPVAPAAEAIATAISESTCSRDCCNTSCNTRRIHTPSKDGSTVGKASRDAQRWNNRLVYGRAPRIRFNLEGRPSNSFGWTGFTSWNILKPSRSNR